MVLDKDTGKQISVSERKAKEEASKSSSTSTQDYSIKRKAGVPAGDCRENKKEYLRDSKSSSVFADQPLLC